MECLNVNSGLRNFKKVSSERMDGKCMRAKGILKTGLENMDTQIFFNLVDIDKLINTKATVLNKMIENEYFTIEERNYIRKERRKFINRISAKESRTRMKSDMNGLEDDIEDLQKIRQSLKAEKHMLQKEIHDIATKLITPE